MKISLTQISVVTGLVTLAVQGAVLFGWDISQDQQAWVSAFVVAVGGAVHAFMNPSVPVGITE